MEPDQDDDAELVASVADWYVSKLGRDAVPYLQLEESLSRGDGDCLAAEAWRDIADAAALILARIN
jgi:hypothetical protein